MKKYISLGIMLTLLSGKKYTASYLADKYETSKKTIYRSIDTLLEAGMPINCIQGKNGGYELIKETSINTSFFTTEELCAFISFLKSTHHNINKSSLPLEERLNQIKDKSLVEELKNESKSLVIDTNIWGYTEIENDLTKIIKKAIASCNKIQIEYLNKNNCSTEIRLIQPYTLVYKTNMWYVYAYCERRKEFRLFKLSRIKNLNVLEIKYQKENIDVLCKPWNKSFKENLEQIEIVLKCSYEDLNDIKEWLGKDVIETKINKQFLLEGKAYFSLGLVHKIMEYGNKVTIVKPEKLKDAILKECYNICKTYTKEKTHFC